MVGFNCLILSNEIYDWNLNKATAINSKGWIVGKGKYKGKVQGFFPVTESAPCKRMQNLTTEEMLIALLYFKK
jgi:hypothetical protein